MMAGPFMGPKLVPVMMTLSPPFVAMSCAGTKDVKTGAPYDIGGRRMLLGWPPTAACTDMPEPVPGAAVHVISVWFTDTVHHGVPVESGSPAVYRVTPLGPTGP